LLYRLLLGLGEGFLYGVCRIRVEVEGHDVLPGSGGYILAAALHRNWIDPLIAIRAVPRQPRVWFLGSAPTAFDKPWKERLLRRTGGILPVWRGGRGVAVHVEATQAVIDEGAVLCLFIEGAIVGPPDRVWPGVRGGSGILALRTGAPIVICAMTGSHELYRGKRIAVRLMAPTSAADLLGDAWPAEMPAKDSRDELRLARQVTQAIAARIDAVLPEMAARVADPPDRSRRWRWLTRLMR
jgi:1-acyl-sn-glycerol-3-phosphate acyltransferase